MAKYWCNLCKTFVLDSKAGRAQHESSPRHKNNIERQISTMQRDKREREKQTQAEMQALQKMGVNVPNSKPHPGSSAAVKKPVVATPSEAPQESDAETNIASPTSVNVEPGQWMAVAPPSPPNDKKRSIDEQQTTDGAYPVEETKPHVHNEENDHPMLGTKTYRPVVSLDEDEDGEEKPVKKKSMFKKRKVASK